MIRLPTRAGVVKLADTHGSGPCAGNRVEVQVLSPAPLQVQRAPKTKSLGRVFYNTIGAAPTAERPT
jgi:hypothetical protein